MNKEFLYTLLNTVSVSGCEEPNQRNVLDYMKDVADQQFVDPVGNVINVIHPEAEMKVLLGGYIDEIGFRVTYIDDQGMIHVQKAGGVRPILYVGMPMQIMHEVYEDGGSSYRTIEGAGVVSS